MKKIKFKRKKKNFNIYFLILPFIICIVLISTSYSLWNTNLYIDGSVVGEYQEPALPGEVVQNGDRYSADNNFKGGWLGVEVFTFVRDTYEGNTITTEIRNGRSLIFTNSISPTFSISITNNSGYTYTNGQVTVEEKDTNSKISPGTPTLSATTVENGETVTLTAAITFSVRNSSITVGDYVNYKISFDCNGTTKYINYKILIVS